MRLRSIGILRLSPNTFALIAVHKQTAASRSTSPSISEQHGTTGGLPTLNLIKSSTLAHTPSFKVSTGHVVPLGVGLGVGFGFGVGGFGFGVGGLGLGHSPQAFANVKKSRFTARKRAMVTLGLDSMT
ncbi:hypothetical protein LUZ60_014453 [Juncus effusus]|nr:hypothetical protein LUZ60_014453 [Juncus effusus]